MTITLEPMPLIEEAEELTARELLIRARDLISDESRWVQGAFQDADGRLCAVGALRTAATGSAYGRTPRGAYALLEQAAQRVWYDHIREDRDWTVPFFNDYVNHYTLMVVFDEAIAQA